jgi:hypothetical protein
MQVGDTFSCLQFALGKELILSNFLHAGSDIAQTYIVGQTHGLTTLHHIHR